MGIVFGAPGADNSADGRPGAAARAPVNITRLLLAALALLPASGRAAAPAKPVIYNNLAGDGSVELDRSIKAAYGSTYAIVDTSRAAGFAEPAPTAGELPRLAMDAHGQPISGYCLIVYIVSAAGLVSDPVIVRWSDERVCPVALAAMGDWRFTPGRLNGTAVASTAAQEFTFGPAEASGGFSMERLVVYQPKDVLVRRLPPNEAVSAYVEQVRQVAHNFFVGSATPETFHIVIVARPGRGCRFCFLSSVRPGSAPELLPLRKLLVALPPLAVREGPVILCLTAHVAGGDGKDEPNGDAFRNPIPKEWRDLSSSLRDPPPFSSDAFLDLLWPPPR
jgi:hypothetical protein